jgi:hypothetical protein
MDNRWLRERALTPERLAARLRHVRWLGGGSGAGKSTSARRLASEYGLRLYDTDEAMAAHAARSTPAEAPLLHAFMAMDMDKRWVNRSPDEMYETFHWFRGEGFGLIVDDLLAEPQEPLILVEGFRLLPRLIAPLLSLPDQAVWLAPTPDFRRAAFASRASTWKIPNKTSDPERALANLLARDQRFTEEGAREADALGLSLIEVTGALSVEELTARVGARLGLDGGRSDGESDSRP